MDAPRIGVPAQPLPPQAPVAKRNSGAVLLEHAPPPPPVPLVLWRLALPTSFVWVVALLHVAWRGLGLYVQQILPQLEPLDGIALVLVDLSLTALSFLLFRLSVLGQSGDLNVRRRLDVWTGTALAVLWAVSTLLREAQLVYLTVFSADPQQAAPVRLPSWWTVVQHPGTWLALVLAGAFGALWRYSASCDLDEALEAARASGREPVRRALGGIAAFWMVLLGLSLTIAAERWGGLPELELLRALATQVR